MERRVLKPNEIEPCQEVCHECGFLNDSQHGVLKEDLGLLDIIKDGILFPCHLQLKAVTGSENEGVEQYVEETNTFKVCRGYVESMYISENGAEFADNPIWKKLFNDVKGNINPKVMTISETIDYHKQRTKDVT